MPKQNKFTDPVYGYTFHLFLGEKGFAHINKHFNHIVGLAPTHRMTTGKCLFVEDFKYTTKLYSDINTLVGLYFSELFLSLSENEQAAIIAHECYHLTERCLPACGVDIIWGSYNEHIAYYLTFLVENYTNLIYAKKG